MQRQVPRPFVFWVVAVHAQGIVSATCCIALCGGGYPHDSIPGLQARDVTLITSGIAAASYRAPT
eukprot:59662-Pyramimonas_sp.AAC.1